MQTPTIFTTTLLLLATTATAATLPPRQIGNLACNLARLQIVGALNDAGSAAGSIADTTTQAAVSAGIDQANAGVGAVAQALLSGGAASADGRDEVAAGLTAANEALAGADR